MRQSPDEMLLVNAINELSTGGVSATTTAFLGSLTNNKLPCNDFKVTHLSALNDQVAIYNKVMLAAVHTREMAFDSVDVGDQSRLLKIPVEKVINRKKTTIIYLL